jgi:hypothetical protein
VDELKKLADFESADTVVENELQARKASLIARETSTGFQPVPQFLAK